MNVDQNKDEEAEQPEQPGQGDAGDDREQGQEQPGGEESAKPARAGIADILFIPVIIGVGISILAGPWAGILAGFVAFGIELLFLRGMLDPS